MGSGAKVVEKGIVLRRFSLVLLAALLSLAACMLSDLPTPPGAPVTATHAIPFTLIAPATETPPTAAPTNTLPPPPVAVADALGPYQFPSNVNPLTGLAVSDPAMLDHRPIDVKISNAPPLVRPQAGIGEADIVYEHYAEGGLTRFSAVFYSQFPERVGSIRSARIIDYEVVPMYQALLAYSGASNGVNAMIAGSDFFPRTYMGIQYGAPYYYRDEEIEVPHNLFVNLAALSRLASEEGLNQRPDLRGMAFYPAAPPDANGDANAVDIRYIATHVRWEYDRERGVYKRFSDGQGHFDALTMQQVTADNVVVLYADHSFTDIAESEWQGNISYSIAVKLWFEGDAVLFRDGKYYLCRWIRPTREDMVTLRTSDGEILYFKPGNTWFQMMRPPDQQDPAEEGLSVE
jgi:hypothetical protein